MLWAAAVLLLSVRALYRGVVTPPPCLSVEPCRLDLNRASAADLEVLPGIGPRRAEALVLARLRGGPFLALEDLLRVDGFGPEMLWQLRPHVCF